MYIKILYKLKDIMSTGTPILKKKPHFVDGNVSYQMNFFITEWERPH